MLSLLCAGLLAALAGADSSGVSDSIAGSAMASAPAKAFRGTLVAAPEPPLWGPGESILAAGMVAGTFALMPFDEDAQVWASQHHSAPSRGWAATSKAIGDGYVTIPVAGLLWALGDWKDQPRLVRASRNGLEAWCLTQLVVQSSKYGFHRWRPSESNSSRKWNGPGLGSEHLSFPSGHSASAWGLLPAYAMEYSEGWTIPLLAYALSASTSLSRVHDGQHWMSDVFFSAGVGVLSNRLVRRWNSRKERAVAVVPLWQDGQRGVTIVSGF